MRMECSELAKTNPDCELRLGASSWDPDNPESKSIKFASKDKNGKTARSGEVPVEALPQMLEFAIREGYLTLS